MALGASGFVGWWLSEPSSVASTARAQPRRADSANMVRDGATRTTGANHLVDGEITGPARIIDGDTLEINGQRIRLQGIDAPESKQFCAHRDGTRWRCGQRATRALAEKIDGGPVRCVGNDRGRYGRLIAVCYRGGENLNAWLVSRGLAVAYRRYSMDYVGEEARARKAGLGVWSGRFVMPWKWRRGARLGGSRAGVQPSGACRIKGNISRSGERIYHIPGGRWYTRTRIDTAKGERWFCSEKAARAAGWRRSRQ